MTIITSHTHEALSLIPFPPSSIHFPTQRVSIINQNHFIFFHRCASLLCEKDLRSFSLNIIIARRPYRAREMGVTINKRTASFRRYYYYSLFMGVILMIFYNYLFRISWLMSVHSRAFYN